MSRSVEVGVNYWPSRYLPPQAGAEFASQLEATGVVDWFQTWDQLVSFLPQALWRPDVTPMARLTADCDSYYNAAMVAVLAANATTRLNITTTLDAVRNGPAELLQQMLTLAAATPPPWHCSLRPVSSSSVSRSGGSDLRAWPAWRTSL